MKKTKNKFYVSFFVPCLNEKENIIATIHTIQSVVKKIDMIYEIIVIDDNSSDNSYQLLEDFKYKNSLINLILIKNKFTKGLGRNYIDASFIAKGKYFMLVNGDNVEPEETLITILNEIGNADMIIPYFGNNDKRRFFRIVLSKTFTFLINFVSGYNVPYYNGPVLHLRYNIMRWSPDTNGFAYQAELITRILSEEKSFKSVKIKNEDRSKGESNAFNIQNILSVGHSLLQIFLRRLRSFLFHKKSET